MYFLFLISLSLTLSRCLLFFVWLACLKRFESIQRSGFGFYLFAFFLISKLYSCSEWWYPLCMCAYLNKWNILMKPIKLYLSMITTKPHHTIRTRSRTLNVVDSLSFYLENFFVLIEVRNGSWTHCFDWNFLSGYISIAIVHHK